MKETEKIQSIHEKGFSFFDNTVTEFNHIRVGTRTLDDAVLKLGDYKRVNPSFGNKTFVLNAIQTGDIETMREISEFFFKTSGIYSRLCRYMAYLYRYDWLITPYINGDSPNIEVILKNFHKALYRLDEFGVKKTFGEIALKVMRRGCYYCYLIEGKDKSYIQELPVNYCRSRYAINDNPVVEFNMAFFDNHFKTTELKQKILKLFPKEFEKGYKLYKQGKLKSDTLDRAGWFTLDPNYAFKFNLNDEDYPAFISVIPAIIDLDEAQDLDKKKMQQELLKIIIQKMPLDKNGELIFDIDEARDLHNNAVRMLGKAIGIDVLTTFADVDVADTSTAVSPASTDNLERVERSVYNEAGVSQMQFNTDGNIALEKSILNDEAALYNLIQQFEKFLNCLLRPYNKSFKKVLYRAQLLSTTIYNYKEMAKLFKEQTAMGYSKMLPQIALGQSQSAILANAYFENQVLELFKVFIPPLNTNTMNAEALASMGDGVKGGIDNENNKDGAGRPELADDEKSEKTIANKESAS